MELVSGIDYNFYLKYSFLGQNYGECNSLFILKRKRFAAFLKLIVPVESDSQCISNVDVGRFSCFTAKHFVHRNMPLCKTDNYYPCEPTATGMINETWRFLFNLRLEFRLYVCVKRFLLKLIIVTNPPVWGFWNGIIFYEIISTS
jgi:hypothetical protein